MSRDRYEAIIVKPEDIRWEPPSPHYPGKFNVATKEDSNVEIEEEDDGQLAWLLPRGANPLIGGVRCTCGVAISTKDPDISMHSDWCDLRKSKPFGGDDVPNY